MMNCLSFFKNSPWKNIKKKKGGGGGGSVALIRGLNLPAAALLRNKLSSASKTITSHCFPGIKSNLSKPKGPNLNIMHSKGRKWQWEMSVCWGDVEGKNQVYTWEEKGAKAVEEQGESWTSEGQRNAGHQKNLNGKWNYIPKILRVQLYLVFCSDYYKM